MTFYTIDYLKTQSDTSYVIKWVCLGILLVVGLFFVVKYFRRRHEGRYRDVAVLVALAGAFIIGLQIQDADGLEKSNSNRQQLVKVMQTAAKEAGASSRDAAIDNTTVDSDMVVKVKSAYYHVQFNTNMNTFTLTPAEPTAAANQIEVKTGKN